jgi:hypothetical protein
VSILSGTGFMGEDAARGDALKRLLEQMQRVQAMGNIQAEGYGARGLFGLQQGFDQAINNVARTGAASRTAAIGAGKQAGAAAGQSLSGRGLYNTSALNSAQAMNTGATSQALASIDQAVANSKAGLQTAKGQSLNSAYQGLGALAQQNAQQQMMPLQMAYQQTANAPGRLQQIMGIMKGVGSLAGMGFGGGFGGKGAYGGNGGSWYDQDSEMG